MKNKCNVDILGVPYVVQFDSDMRTKGDGSSIDGFCNGCRREININKMFDFVSGTTELHIRYVEQIIAHEVIHAIIFESGLDRNVYDNEENLVNWIAFQYKKIDQVVKFIMNKKNWQ